jgi:hypothetical protein
MSDNLHFDLTGFSLETCLDIASKVHKHVEYYATEPAFKGDSDRSWIKPHGQRLILGWAAKPNPKVVYGTGSSSAPFKHPETWIVYPMVTKMPTTDMEQVVRAWLSNAADYGRQPDHDGDNEKGWRCYNEAWGHIGSDWTAFAAFEPVWLMYGK